MKKIISLFICLILISVFYFSWKSIQFLFSPGSSDNEAKEVIFEVSSGEAFNSISRRLYENKLISSLRYFNLFAKISGKTTKLQVGEFAIRTNMTPTEVLRELTSGKSITYNLTIPEGHNIYNIRDQLNSMWVSRGDEFFKIVTDRAYIHAVTKNLNIDSLEGYVYPETYVITKFTPMKTLVDKMVKYSLGAVDRANKSAKIKMSTHEHITLASVIEKETGVPEERPLIASVFHNRLNKKMKLQSDPTILYGILVKTGTVTKNITRSDINQPTPYNTYTVKALPYGPIANPGFEALKAAVNPVDSKYLYFVSRNDGTHVFSETYEAHNKAVRNFQLDRKAREGKSWRDFNKNK